MLGVKSIETSMLGASCLNSKSLKAVLRATRTFRMKKAWLLKLKPWKLVWKLLCLLRLQKARNRNSSFFLSSARRSSCRFPRIWTATSNLVLVIYRLVFVWQVIIIIEVLTSVVVACLGPLQQHLSRFRHNSKNFWHMSSFAGSFSTKYQHIIADKELEESIMLGS